ncbi:MAG: hypothetical protein ACRD0G_11340, partial [Acidimicrobiales bacterium]
MLLSAQVHAMTWFADFRHRLAAAARDDRGDAYTSTIMIAIGVVIAIAVGGILMVKFTGKAESIDTDTPVAPA